MPSAKYALALSSLRFAKGKTAIDFSGEGCSAGGRDVCSSACYIRSIIHIDNRIDRSAVNAHAQFNLGMVFKRRGDFHCAFEWRFRIIKKYQSHSIPRWDANELSLGLGLEEARRVAHNLV